MRNLVRGEIHIVPLYDRGTLWRPWTQTLKFAIKRSYWRFAFEIRIGGLYWRFALNVRIECSRWMFALDAGLQSLSRPERRRSPTERFPLSSRFMLVMRRVRRKCDRRCIWSSETRTSSSAMHLKFDRFCSMFVFFGVLELCGDQFAEGRLSSSCSQSSFGWKQNSNISEKLNSKKS